jgi:mycofactocin biosynthesis protein MftB
MTSSRTSRSTGCAASTDRRVDTVEAPITSEPATAATVTTASSPAFDRTAPWRLHPGVAVRPEPFGALLYHYGTRRLTFVKDSTLLRVLQSLEGSSSVDAAMVASEVPPESRTRYAVALERLAATDMLLRHDARPDDEHQTARQKGDP